MQQLLGSLKKGLVFVISAPAGTGKTTLVRMLTQEFSSVSQSISYTTRKMRVKEVDGRDYHFIDRAAFEKKISEGDFLEHAEVFDELYGTSKKSIEALQQSGKHVVLVIDTQGAMQLMKQGFDATFIFLVPPSLNELKRRLSSRKSECMEKMDERLSWAEKEIALSSHYDYRIVNEDLKVAYETLRSVLIAEEHRVREKS